MSALALLVTSLTTGWVTLGTAAALLVTRRDPHAATAAEASPPVTVLKPLCGADPGLRENLETFFTQDHPRFELLFGVERADDPAVPVVEALLAAHPGVRARLVVHAPGSGQNPKVRNLRGMLPHAAHDLVLVSDSNVRAPRDYVRRAAAMFASAPDVGLVTHLVVGSVAGGARATLGADLACVELTGFCAGGAALPTAVGDAAVIGKSMLFSRATLCSLGGLARVADVLAEDYVIGKMFQHAGYRVVIGETVVENVVGEVSVGAFFARHLRWSMLRARLRPAAFLLEPLACPIAVLPIAWTLAGPWALAWLAALFVVRDAVPWARFKGLRGLHKPLALALVRDVLALAIWCATPFQHHASWRGHRVRVGAGTLLFTDAS